MVVCTRPRDDVEYLWDAVADGHVDWIVTDHASAPTDFKPVSFQKTTDANLPTF